MRAFSPFKSLRRKKIYCFSICISLFFLLPFILFGTNSIVTIHDNLDYQIPWYKMYYDNGLFLKFDVPTKGYSEMSTLYYSQVGFSFQSLLYLLFSDFTAYVLSYYFSLCFGCLSMYILLKKTFGFSSSISFYMALCYAILPVIPVWNIAVSTLPLIIAVFSHFALKNNCGFSWKILFLLFFPFFSFFSSIGIFILGFWFIGLISFGIKNKKVNPNLLIGFFLLCIGYILVDLRLFYVMFVLKTPLNRDIRDTFQGFFPTLKTYCGNGHYHAASFQRKIIIPLASLVSLSCLIMIIRRINEQSGTIATRIKTIFKKNDILIKQLFIVEFITFVFYCINALYYSGLLNGFLTKYIPQLSGFNWGRVWIFNRILWYVIYALCLQLVLGIEVSNFIKKIKVPVFLPQFIVGILICLQILYIALTPALYNDQIKTWFNELVIKTGIARKIIPNKSFNSFISYREFFAMDLFDEIKKDIHYSDERVVAFGYHPSVLMYNGFNCIDGYNNLYPLVYMQRFRALIAPELEVNQWAREYYDKWGGRIYLYDSERSYQPTRDKNTSPVTLNIDMNVFRNDFEGKYILSRTEVSNSDTLGITLVNRYYDEKSIYTIYLYQGSRQVP